MSRTPLVSVLMNCFNGEKYLREAIDSVMAQSYPNWEIIFWDNQSTDHSAEICKSYGDSRIRYFRASTHTNLGEARALALNNIHGDFVAVLDTDDLWLPDKLTKQLPYFDDPRVGVVISDTLYFTDGGSNTRQLFARGLPPQGYVFADLLDDYFVSLETVMMRRSAIDTLSHAFDPCLSHISDFDLIVRLAKDWKLVCVNEVLAQWRIHPGSGSWAEPDRFFKEKMLFIQKMDALPEYSGIWLPARNRFLRHTMVSEAMTQLARNEPRRCREILSPYLVHGGRAILVYALSWLPFGDQVVRRYRARKALE